MIGAVARAWSSRRLGRIVVVASLLLLIVPPSLAYGWTRRRYGSGTDARIGIYAVTNGQYQRVYNAAYFPSGGFLWRVSYNFSGAQGADEYSYNQSWNSGVSLGSTGPFNTYAQCYPVSSRAFGGAWNCDTTIP